MDRFQEKIEKTIEICKIELQRRKEGIFGESTEKQLEGTILPELYNLLTFVKNEEVLDKQDRYLNSFANAFTVWGWNMQTPTELFVLLAELNNDYKNL